MYEIVTHAFVCNCARGVKLAKLDDAIGTKLDTLIIYAIVVVVSSEVNPKWRVKCLSASTDLSEPSLR